MEIFLRAAPHFPHSPLAPLQLLLPPVLLILQLARSWRFHFLELIFRLTLVIGAPSLSYSLMNFFQEVVFGEGLFPSDRVVLGPVKAVYFPKLSPWVNHNTYAKKD